MNPFWHPLAFSGAYISISVWISAVLLKSISWYSLPYSKHLGTYHGTALECANWTPSSETKLEDALQVWSAHSTKLNLVQNCTQGGWGILALFYSQNLFSLLCTTCCNREVPLRMLRSGRWFFLYRIINIIV